MTREQLLEHCKKCKERVAKMPAWKRQHLANILGKGKTHDT